MTIESMDKSNRPTASDIGSFIPESELIAWLEMQKQRFPELFLEEDNIFGEQGHQHRQGTKIMAYLHDDPSKPMRFEIVGSRWVLEMGGKFPNYVVRGERDSELSQIALTSAHEEGGWQMGWDVPPLPK